MWYILTAVIPRQQITVEPPVSDHPKYQMEVVAYYMTVMDQIFSSLEYDNRRNLAHAPMLMQCFIHVKVNFERKIRFFPL